MYLARLLRTLWMNNVNCPHCGGLVLQEDRLAGQVVSCPGCKKPFQMPAADNLGHFAFEQDASVPRAAIRAMPLTMSAEPWYCRLLARYVVTGMWIALTMLGLLALSIVVTFLVSLGQGGLSLYIILALMICLSLLVLMLLAVVFGVALIFLALDASRTLREIRQSTMKRP